MADITIATDVAAVLNADDGESFAWANQSAGYKFYLDNTVPLFRYRRTTDGGQTWGAPVTVNSDAHFARHAAWPDWATPGDSGVLIHLVYDGGNGIRYRNLDTATGVLSAERTVTNPGSNQSTDVQITKSRNGDLHVTWNSASAILLRGYRRSTDGGASWAAVGALNPIEANGDHVRMMPASNTGDDADMWLFYWDLGPDDISIKVFDASVPSFTETSISVGMEAGVAGSRGNWGISVRHSDGHVLLYAWNTTLLATSDLKGWKINGAGSIVALADVVTDSPGFRATVLVDQNTDYLYVAYCTTFAAGEVVYKVSQDGGTTWGVQVQFSTLAGNPGQVQAGLSTSPTGGRWSPAWFDDVPDDWKSNFGNSIILEPLAFHDISPDSGPVNGGSAVRITGTGFTGATGVTFDGVPATNFTVVDDGLVKCDTPAHRVGVVDVVVDGATLADAYAYVGPPDRYHVGETGSALLDYETGDGRVVPFKT